MDKKNALQAHFEWAGKLEVTSRVAVKDSAALSVAYTPGVAQPCLAIRDDPSLSFSLTRRWNTVAVITDGTAVLGLGDIGPEAGMPVMEGKCVLFKEFGGVDAIPLCLKTKDVDELVRTIYLLSGSFGGVNLEDIAAPRCFEVERRLKELCDIPVFHDDQHGTAVVVGAALLNALRVVGKSVGAVRCVINGAGSAGVAIAKHLMRLGVGDLVLCDRAGILSRDEMYDNPAHNEMAACTNPAGLTGTLADAMRGAGMPEGPSSLGRMGEETPCIVEDGVAKLPDRSAFAGSVATADRLLRTVVKACALPVEKAVMPLTSVPARILGLPQKGSLRVGADADLVQFDENVEVSRVILGGIDVPMDID